MRAHDSRPRAESTNASPAWSSQQLIGGWATFAALLTVAIAGCQHRATTPTPIAPEMRDAYSATSQLFGYVWNPAAFNQPSNERTIEGLLDRLAGDFHRVERKAPLTMFEPGFAVTLRTNREMLGDVRRRFSSGAKDYAMWRLRSLTETCISCHSRYNVPSDFVGAPPQPTDSSFDARYGSAQFLFATRQFDRAANDLYALAEGIGSAPSGGKDAIRALELWLVIQVRVKSRYAEAAKELERLAPKFHTGPYPQDLLRTWSRELRMLEKPDNAAKTPLEAAQHLLSALAPERGLAPVQGGKEKHGKKSAKGHKSKAHSAALGAPFHEEESRTEDTDLALLPRTLRATAILHTLLPTEQELSIRRRASLLLAQAYVHLPIETFAVFRELYLEQCIREFPGTDEAKVAFQRYESLVRDSATGSGGEHLDQEQQKKLDELRQLSHGSATET